MKRILIALALALSAVSSFGTTLNPIQLLNPAGSTSGQVIASTGATTAPAWTIVTLSGLGGMPISGGTFTGPVMGPTPATTDASTKLATTSMVNSAFSSPPVSIGGGVPTSGAFTSLSAPSGLNNTPIGLASPQPATVTNLTASGTVSGAGFTTLLSPYLTTASAASTYAALASPTITTPNIVGTAGIAAASGSVGQHQTFGNAVGTVSLPTSTATNCFSQSLTAGSYQLSGVINITAGAGNTISFPTGGISTTSASLGVFGTFTQTGATFGTASSIYMTLPTVYFDLTTTTTVYAVGSATNTGTGTCGGNITVLRIH